MASRPYKALLYLQISKAYSLVPDENLYPAVPRQGYCTVCNTSNPYWAYRCAGRPEQECENCLLYNDFPLYILDLVETHRPKRRRDTPSPKKTFGDDTGEESHPSDAPGTVVLLSCSQVREDSTRSDYRSKRSAVPSSDAERRSKRKNHEKHDRQGSSCKRRYLAAGVDADRTTDDPQQDAAEDTESLSQIQKPETPRHAWRGLPWELFGVQSYV